MVPAMYVCVCVIWCPPQRMALGTQRVHANHLCSAPFPETHHVVCPLQRVHACTHLPIEAQLRQTTALQRYQPVPSLLHCAAPSCAQARARPSLRSRLFPAAAHTDGASNSPGARQALGRSVRVRIGAVLVAGSMAEPFVGPVWSFDIWSRGWVGVRGQRGRQEAPLVSCWSRVCSCRWRWHGRSCCGRCQMC